MKQALNLMTVILVLSMASTAFAAVAPKGECEKAALAAALKELKIEFPDSPGKVEIDSIHETATQVTIVIENENISDLPVDVISKIRRSGNSCEVVGTPDVEGQDPS